MSKKLTAKRIAKLRGKVKHFRLYRLSFTKSFYKDDDYEVAYGLNYKDAIRRMERKENRRDSVYTPLCSCEEVFHPNLADYALVSEGSLSRSDVRWVRFSWC